MKLRNNVLLVSFFVIMAIIVPSFLFAQAENWRSIGLKYLIANEPEKAISFFRLAVSSDGSNASYREELAYALQESGLYDEALDNYTVAIGLPGADLLNIKYNMALVYAAKEDYNKARSHMSEVIKMNPNVNSAYLNRANFGINQKNYTAAEKDYRAFLEKDPDTPQKPEIEKMLKILASYKKFSSSNLDKEKYNEKKALEEELNKQRKRIQNTPSNQFLGETQQ